MGDPLRVALVNMPFAPLQFPSFALSQLASVLRENFVDRVHVEVIYANHQFARNIGVDAYETLTNPELHDTGVGEWMFRSAAFPHLESNLPQYLDTYFNGPNREVLRTLVCEVSKEARDFCSALVDRCSLREADLVGCTSMFAQMAPSLGLARAVKTVAPDVLTAMGGANCEAPMGAELAKNADVLDLVFAGPALRSFPDIVSQLLEGKHTGELSLVPGVVSKETAANPVARHSVGMERPVDELILPDFSAFVEAFDLTCGDRGTEPILFFETSRGCWWGEKSHCTFCGLNGSLMSYRSMSPDVAVPQIERMFEYNPWCSTLFGVDNIMPTEYIDTVFPKLNPPHGENILYEVKVNNLGRQELRTLAAGGVTWVQPGIEALATHTLKLMGKGVSSFQNVIFLKDCIDCGVCPVWNLLTGFPGELEETYQHYLHCIPLLYHLPPPTGLTRVRFDRYSPYFTKADEYGLELQPFAYYSLTFPFAEDALREIAYYFTDERDNEYKRLIDTWWPSLDPLVETWRERWSDPRQAPICRLTSTDTAWTIVDTRGDQPHQYEIATERAKLLHALGKDRRVTQLIARGGPGVSADLGWLRERGLLFEERGRVVSLVHADSPATTEALLAETVEDRRLLSDGQ